jgi:hypothetical protein
MRPKVSSKLAKSSSKGGHSSIKSDIYIFQNFCLKNMIASNQHRMGPKVILQSCCSLKKEQDDHGGVPFEPEEALEKSEQIEAKSSLPAK